MMRPVVRRLAVLAVLSALSLPVSPEVSLRAQTSSQEAGFDAGLTAYNAGRYADAERIWLPLAESGDALAQYSLGKLYEAGGNGNTDFAAAARWYEMAAQQDQAAAQNNLGLMYAQGRGVPRDPARAARLWSRSANASNPMAQYNLGLAYFRGEGVGQDQVEAAVWFHLAAAAGLGEAQFALGQMHQRGLALPQNDSQALYWYERAAASGHADAEAQAGRLRARGVSVAESAEVIDPDTLLEDPDQEVGSGDREQLESRLIPPAKAPAPETAPAPAGTAAIARQDGSALPRAAAQSSGSQAGDPGEEADGSLLWLLSSRDQARAGELLDEAEKGYADALAGQELAVVPVDSNEGGRYFRLVVRTGSVREATETCRRIREINEQAFCAILGR